jgi:hypothetical protein
VQNRAISSGHFICRLKTTFPSQTTQQRTTKSAHHDRKDRSMFPPNNVLIIGANEWTRKMMMPNLLIFSIHQKLIVDTFRE